MDIQKTIEEKGIETTTTLDTLIKAQKLGIEIITINFDGGGDEGYIDSVDYVPDMSDWKGTEEEKEEFLSFINDEAALTIVCNHLDFDWQNNGGGNGSINIVVDKGEITISAVEMVDHYEQANLFYDAGLLDE